MSHQYIICEQYDHREEQHTSRYMPADESGRRVGCGGSSRVTNLSRHDPLEEELDPCLSAAVRYKKEASNGLMKMKFLLCCIIFLLALALLTVALIMVFGSSPTTPRVTKLNPGEGNGSIFTEPGTKVATPSIRVITVKTLPPVRVTPRTPPVRRPFTKPTPTKHHQSWKTTTTPRRMTTSTTTMTSTTTTTTMQNKILVPGSVHDCDNHYKMGDASGVYKMRLEGFGSFEAYCEMEAGQGWVVLQRRSSDKIPFWNNTFEEYAKGFGDVDGDHWLGLERVHAFAARSNMLQMRIRLEGDFCQRPKKGCSGFGEKGRWLGEWEFTLGDRTDGFRLMELKFLRGNLSDLDLSYDKEIFSSLCNNQRFTTADLDSDTNKEKNCAIFRKRGAWWHSDCAHTALNGQYGSSSPKAEGFFWHRAAPETNAPHGSYIIKPMRSLILFRVLR